MFNHPQSRLGIHPSRISLASPRSILPSLSNPYIDVMYQSLLLHWSLHPSPQLWYQHCTSSSVWSNLCNDVCELVRCVMTCGKELSYRGTILYGQELRSRLPVWHAWDGSDIYNRREYCWLITRQWSWWYAEKVDRRGAIVGWAKYPPLDPLFGNIVSHISPACSFGSSAKGRW